MIKCKICNSKNTILYMKGIYDSDETEVIECEDCNARFLHPFMTLEEEKKYYEDYYASQAPRYTSELSLEKIQQKTYNRFLDYIQIYSSFKKPSSILEIGSGTGGFLKLLNEKFLQKDVYSAERSDVNMNFLRKSFPTYRFARDIVEFKDIKFDLIAAFALFEHIRNPKELLVQIRSMLVNDGRLFLEVPNLREPLISLYSIEEFKKFHYQKQHYFTYSEKSIKILAEDTEFKVEDFYYIQSYGLDNHLSWLIYKKLRNFQDMTNLISKSSNKRYKKKIIENKTTDVLGVILKKSID